MDLPGFYYDRVKGKYFKIQGNHIAPPQSKYSSEAIKEQKQRVIAEKTREQRRLRERSQRLTQAREISHPLTSIQTRLGTFGHGDVSSTVAQYYCASLQRRQVLMPGVQFSPHFSFHESNPQTLVVGTTSVNQSTRGISSILTLRQDEDNEGGRTWSRGTRANVVQTAGRIESLIFTGRGLLAWTEDSGEHHIQLQFSCTVASGTTGAAQLHVAALHYDTWDMAPQTHYTIRDEQKLHLAMSPCKYWWLAWTSKTMTIRSGSGPGIVGAETYVSRFKKRDPILTAAFKDEWTLMAGHRSGFVNFLDHRDDTKAQVCRLRHDSPLNALQILVDGHTILANGMTTTVLYDLRYLAAPRTAKPFEPFSTPVLRFSTPHTSDRLELGVDYYEDIHTVAIASSENKSHHVNLYSTKTGKVIPSNLDDTTFDGPIPCLKFVHLSDRPARLLMTTTGEVPTLTEWACDL